MTQKSRSDLNRSMGSSDPIGFSRYIMDDGVHSLRSEVNAMITTLLIVLLLLVVVGVALLFAAWPYVLAAAIAIAAFRFVKKRLASKSS